MQKNLLIVDDEPEVRQVLSEGLKALDANIYVAKDSKEALDFIKSKQITAILSDISMPGMKGIELLRAIRQDGYLTPFVILTAYGDKKVALEALRLGALDLISKPWVNEKLFETIQKALELGSQVAYWENQVDMKTPVFDYREENIQQLLVALSQTHSRSP
jgi:two-component system, NtrC family, response regulator AtoC